MAVAAQDIALTALSITDHVELALYVDFPANSTYKSPIPPPIPRKTRRVTMARASDPIDRFGRFLAQSEHSPLTVKSYRGDLEGFQTHSFRPSVRAGNLRRTDRSSSHPTINKDCAP
jgi:hypothetical protein